jgi:hypothetical protein
MKKAGPLLALLAPLLGCGNADNLILGGIGSSDRTPAIQFDNVRSAISGRTAVLDANGNPSDTKLAVVILSDSPDLCAKLKTHKDYFRKPPETYIALILFVPPDRLGTFLPGRIGDEGTGSEIIGIGNTSLPADPFVAVDQGFISMTNWSDSPSGTTSGNFNLLYAAPRDLGVNTGFPFTGRFKAAECPDLDGTLLP